MVFGLKMSGCGSSVSKLILRDSHLSGLSGCRSNRNLNLKRIRTVGCKVCRSAGDGIQRPQPAQYTCRYQPSSWETITASDASSRTSCNTTC